MKFGKIIGIFVVVLVAVTFLGIVSAADVTVGIQHFNLPDGFKENTTMTKERTSSTDVPGSDSTNTNSFTKSFENGKDVIVINVHELPGKPVLKEESGFSNKTINGVDGIYNPDTHEFRYVNGTNMISMSGSNDSLFEDFVMA